MDLSLYKDEAQLDKISPSKRKRGIKSEDGDDDEDDDYEEAPRKKKKNAGKTPVVRSQRAVPTKKTATYESSESDEENLMEIKKKVNKKQVKR